MKRKGFLFEEIVNFTNFVAAFRQALRGKRELPIAQSFYFRYEHGILKLEQEILSGSYRMRPYTVFTICDPKVRQIAAPAFRDHVVAHAIYRVLYPVVDKMYIYDTYASRLEKGPQQAMLRAQKFSRRFHYFLKLDVADYFASIDQEILLATLARKFKDGRLLELLAAIIRYPIPHYPPGKGMALGHLTSQIFANLYLDEMDHLVKEQLRVKGYVRYMDDMLIFANSKEELRHHLKSIENYLHHERLLSLKQKVTILAPVSRGIPFLGFLLFPRLIRLRSSTLQRARKTIKRFEDKFKRGEITDLELQQGVSGLLEHIVQANSYRLRRKWFANRDPEL